MGSNACRRPHFRPPFEPTLDSTLPLLDRPHRERTQLFWAEGCRSFFSALENEWAVRAVVYSPKLLRSRDLWERLRGLRMPVLRASPDQFALLTRRTEPDGVGVVCEQRWSRLIDEEARPGDVWVALDGARTPGNLGTILRTCAAVGARGVMLVGGEADPYDPASIRASMGAVFATRLIRTSAKALAGWKSRRDVRFVGTSPAARLDYREPAYRTPLVLMMGSERSGLRDRQIALCDQVVSLPMTARVDSLNLAVATSVMLYAVMGDG
ncbi:MAG TPA: RNA methyltransferase [Fimbriimonadaceae bacterium]|nr:RNA methyltransferase [Fimbriimonadaceae bacterium]